MRAALLPAILLLGVIHSARPAEDSCEGRCLEGFNSNRKCQCDSICAYYQSCCEDFHKHCNNKDTRGDVFSIPGDENDENVENGTDPDRLSLETTPTYTPEESVIVTDPPVLEPTERPIEETTMKDPAIDDDPEELCSGKSFDAFTNLKNGSIYAFRGKYFYELDDNQALDGNPKLIKEVWGIEGPIDAAFTRMNCQGKTYIFKGTQYWRFSDGILDSDYPRDISIGFKNIPNNIDAVFALPAKNYQGKERAYFFKGRQYWEYEFTQQLTRQECLGSATSDLFTRYALMQDDSWDEVFMILFGPWHNDKEAKARSIYRDWRGVPNGVDAVLPSRISVPQQEQPPERRIKRRKSNRKRNRKRRPSKTQAYDYDSFYLVDLFSYDDEVSDPDWLPPESPKKCQPKPVQSVYFFKNDKYYRVNLRTKRVDFVSPRYPRSIGEYWLGCKKSTEEEKSRS